MMVKEINPRDERRTKTHGRQGKPHEVPVNVVKCLLLIQGKDSNGRARGRSIVDHITKEGNVLPSKMTRDTTGLIFIDDKMDDFEEMASNNT